MNTVKIYSKPILLLAITLMFLSCNHAGKDKLPDPRIQSGIAKVTGKVLNYHLKKGEEIPTITLYVPNSVTAESATFETLLKEDGSFHFEVPVQCNLNIGSINSPFFNRMGFSVGLIPGEVTKLEITFDKAGQIKAGKESNLDFTSVDLMSYGKMMGNFLEANDHDPVYKMSPEDFSHYAVETMMPKRLKIAINDSILSPKALNYITNECKLYYLKGCLLTYSEFISMNYRNTKAKGEPDNFTPQVPKRSYYALLKSFNLNDPQYLYNDSYSVVLQHLLSNETLNIPAIKDTPIQDWLKGVKIIMADLIGSDTGMFYDVLAANAYARQFNYELKPLSEKQITNIKSYFKNVEFTKILLKKNEEVIKSEKGRNYFKTVINKTPSVPKEKLMNAIISKYKGKAVLVDFWATWCGPCMNAMKETAKIKSELYGKNIAFVYITNASSPTKLWEENARIIGGEHYYLTKEEWEYVLNSFGITGIPSYLFFDKTGKLKNNITAYPGTIKMQKMIDELLQ